MRSRVSVGLALLTCVGALAQERPYEPNISVGTYVGSGFYGLVDGVGELNMFNGPRDICTDDSGAAYVWDEGNRRIRKITRNREVITLRSGFEGEALRLIRCDGQGNIYFLSPGGGLFRIPSDGLPVGEPPLYTDVGSPASAVKDLAVMPDGTCFLADGPGNVIKKVTPGGQVSVFVGSGNPGNRDGSGIFCSFNQPYRLLVTRKGELYVVENGGLNLRFVTADRKVTTLEDTADLAGGQLLAVDEVGSLYAFVGEALLKRYPDGRRTWVAGNHAEGGFENGLGPIARFYGIGGVTVSSKGVILLSDAGNHRIRVIEGLSADVEGPALRAGSYFGVSIRGIPGRQYRVETAPSVTGPWAFSTTVLLPESNYLWIDLAHEAEQRYYRAVLVQ